MRTPRRRCRRKPWLANSLGERTLVAKTLHYCDTSDCVSWTFPVWTLASHLISSQRTSGYPRWVNAHCGESKAPTRQGLGHAKLKESEQGEGLHCACGCCVSTRFSRFCSIDFYCVLLFCTMFPAFCSIARRQKKIENKWKETRDPLRTVSWNS